MKTPVSENERISEGGGELARSEASVTGEGAPIDSRQSMIHRRAIVSGGLAIGAAMLLGACQGGPSRAQRRVPARTPLAASGLGAARYPTAANEGLPATLVTGVIPRREWATADTIIARTNPMSGVERITIHHDGMPPVLIQSRMDAARRIDLIRRAHVNNGWADIGYHYIIDPLGNVWEGRPLRFQGAHVKIANERNLGVLVLGNFMDQRPTPLATTALDRFVAAQMRAHRVSLWSVHTHQELSPTACPGVHLQHYMDETRSTRGRLALA